MPPRPGGDCLVHVSSVGGDTGGGAGGAAQGNVHGGAPDSIFIRHKIIFFQTPTRWVPSRRVRSPGPGRTPG